jgi:fatty-acid peroxygenase
LVPQGGGDPRTGHRCPGEKITIALLAALVVRLAELDYDVPEQDLGISLRRIPARPRSGFVLVPRGPSTTSTTSTAAEADRPAEAGGPPAVPNGPGRRVTSG